jgi:hydroxymethylglutaryl-CoA lyase
MTPSPDPKARIPSCVTLMEVSLRDGLQSEKRILPIPQKIALINRLTDAGVTALQVASFVSRKRVPQMADADLLFPLLPKKTGVLYNALVLSMRGLDRALAAGVPSVEISVSASDAHSIANTGYSRERALSDAIRMIRTAKHHGLHVRGGIQCVFGCAFEGKVDFSLVLSMSEQLLTEGIDMLALSDTTGMGTPSAVTSLIEKVAPLSGAIPLALHLHNTGERGLLNLRAALEAGVTIFDTGLEGGGCPVIPGVGGNISTGKAGRMLAGIGVRTGLDMERIDQCAGLFRAFISGRDDFMVSVC